MRLIAIILLATLCACTGYNNTLDLRKPASFSMNPPPGPDVWRQGWRDGCESGSDAYTAPFYKSINAFELVQDPVLRNNKMYYQAWKDAFLYCAISWEMISNSPI